MARIDLKAKAGRPELVTVNPAERLGRLEFDAYLNACRRSGCRFDAGSKAQVAPVHCIGAVCEALTEAGFTPVPDDAVKAVIGRLIEKNGNGKAKADEAVSANIKDLEARGLKLYPFQTVGARWLGVRQRGLLADEMGLGKTIEVLAAIPPEAPVIVLCPAALKYNWRAEFKKWRPEFKVEVLSGRNSFRWPGAGECVVLNYDVLPEALDSAAPAGCVCVVDEAHALKNSKALRTKRWSPIRSAILEADGKVWLLTGTPLLNRPPELWQVLRAANLHEETFGSFRRFLWLFGARPGAFGGFTYGEPKAEVADLLRRSMLKRRRTEVLPDLPTKTYRTVEVNGLDPEMVARLDEFREMLKALGIDLDGAITEAEAARLAGSVLFTELARIRAMLATAKIPGLLGLVEEYEAAEEPVVVFSMHRPPVEALASRPGWARITGSESSEARQEIVKKFQAGELKGLACTTQAAGIGLTLTRAHHAVFVDLAWTPALNSQAEDRLCRIGQDRGVIITSLVATHCVDQRVEELLRWKTDLINKTVEAAAVGPDHREPETDPEIERLKRIIETPTTPSPEPPPVNGRRPAASERERWAERAMLILAGLDSDYAAVKNEVGFNKLDGPLGHSLAAQIQAGKGLTERQWAVAVKLACRYTRQVGAPPKSE